MFKFIKPRKHEHPLPTYQEKSVVETIKHSALILLATLLYSITSDLYRHREQKWNFLSPPPCVACLTWKHIQVFSIHKGTTHSKEQQRAGRGGWENLQWPPRKGRDDVWCTLSDGTKHLWPFLRLLPHYFYRSWLSVSNGEKSSSWLSNLLLLQLHVSQKHISGNVIQ